jgi:regulator of sigma E protease
MKMNNLVEFVLAIAGLIFIHELGHFLACRLLGIEVEEFGIGFPPRLGTLFVRNGTAYTLNALPLGGFVRPKGEGDPSIPGSIEAASPWARLGVYLAGPLMNVLVGIILFTSMFAAYGLPQVRQDVGVAVLDVVPGAPADQAGLQLCDRILAFDGQQLHDVETLSTLTRQHLGEPVTLTVARGAQTFEVTLIPRTDFPPDQGPLGIGINYPVVFEPVAPTQALLSGLGATLQTGATIAALPARLVSGAISYDEGRPVGLKGMYDMYSAARAGDLFACTPRGLSVLNFLASITMSLAVLNLLPIPALDGGRILFLLPELLFRKRIPPRYEMAVNALGFFLLLALMFWINIQDFINPVLK